MPGESLRDQLQAAFDLHSVDDDQGTGAAAASVTGAEGAEGQVAEAAKDPSTETTEQPGGAQRDASGRFTAKDKGEAIATQAPNGDGKPAETPDEKTAKPEESEARKEPTRVPPSLPAAIKAKFANLPDDVQQAFIGLEDSVQKAKAEWGKKGERLNRFDEILGPRVSEWRLKGLDEFSGIQVLLTAQDILERNPLEGLAALARSYGVNLAQVAQQMSGGQAMGQGAFSPGQAPAFDPNALQVMISQALTPLQQQLQTFQQQSEAEKQATAHQTVAEFASRPENIYWEDVKNDVAFLLQNGRANTLEDAYQTAIWASPTIRPLLLQAQQSPAAQPAAQVPAQQQTAAATQAQAQAAARAKAQKAQEAAGSVVGSPQGAVAPRAGSSTGNLRDDLAAAMAQHSGV